MSEQDAELLLQQQAVNLTAITRTIVNARKLAIERRTIPVYQGRLDSWKSEWAEFKLNHALLFQKVEKKARTDDYFTKDIFLVAEIAYQDGLDYLNEKIAALRPAAPAMQPVPTQGPAVGHPHVAVQQSTVKLPRIEIPSFSGKYEDWDNFHDMFDSLVMKNETLNNVQKLHYLKISVSAEAAALLKNFQVTAANYTAAWAAVKAGYNNKRAIINAHLQNFFSMPSVGIDSIVGLKVLRDVTFETRTALKNIAQPVDQWDTSIVYCIVEKLDKQSRREWETKLGNETEYPDFNRLQAFIDTRVRTLEALGSTLKSSEHSEATSNSKFTGKSSHSQSVKTHLASSQVSCYMCLQDHAIYACPSFKDLNVEQRENFVRKSILCTNCLTKGHNEKECKSKYICLKCQQRHHTLLHRKSKSGMTQALQVISQVESNDSPTTSESENTDESIHEQSDNDTNVHLNLKTKARSTKVLLATACVILQSNSGHYIRVRALLDQGSDATFVSERVAQRLRLPRKRVQTAINGLGGSSLGAVRSVVQMLMRPCHEQEPVIPVQALVLQKITSHKPQEFLSFEKYEHLANISFEKPDTLGDDSIDLLIGADYYGQILREGLRNGPLGTPTAQLTIFGWVISGPFSQQPTLRTSLHAHFVKADEDLNSTLKEFWTVEEVPPL